MMQAETQRVYRLTDQIVEKQSAAKGLQVLATDDGVIVQRQLANRLGSFVERGDELLTGRRVTTDSISNCYRRVLM